MPRTLQDLLRDAQEMRLSPRDVCQALLASQLRSVRTKARGHGLFHIASMEHEIPWPGKYRWRKSSQFSSLSQACGILTAILSSPPGIAAMALLLKNPQLIVEIETRIGCFQTMQERVVLKPSRGSFGFVAWGEEQIERVKLIAHNAGGYLHIQSAYPIAWGAPGGLPPSMYATLVAFLHPQAHRKSLYSLGFCTDGQKVVLAALPKAL